MTEPKTFEVTQGERQMRIAQAISDCIMGAQMDGLEVDESICIVAAVAADYGRITYGPEYLESLAKVVKDRVNHAIPGEAIVRKGPLNG